MNQAAQLRLLSSRHNLSSFLAAVTKLNKLDQQVLYFSSHLIPEEINHLLIEVGWNLDPLAPQLTGLIIREWYSQLSQ